MPIAIEPTLRFLATRPWRQTDVDPLDALAHHLRDALKASQIRMVRLRETDPSTAIVAGSDGSGTPRPAAPFAALLLGDLSDAHTCTGADARALSAAIGAPDIAVSQCEITPVQAPTGHPIGAIIAVRHDRASPKDAPTHRAITALIAVHAADHLTARPSPESGPLHIDPIRAAVVVLDLQGNLQQINRAGRALLGDAETLPTGTRFFHTCVTQPQGTTELLPAFRGFVSGHADPNASWHAQMVTPDGQTIPITWRPALLRDAHNGVLAVVCTGAPAAVADPAPGSAQRLQDLLANTARMTNVGGWSLELANRQLMWTPQTHRIHELPEDFVPTVDGAIDFYTEESRSIISAAVATAIEDGESYDLELQIRTAKGNVRWVHTMGTAEFTDGAPTRVWGTFQDITERKLQAERRELLEAQLEQAKKLELVGRLAGGVAHDFNNMLSVILGQTELMLTAPELRTPRHRDLQIIASAAQRSAELTRQLLAFARKQPISPRPMSLNAHISPGLQLLQRLIGNEVELQFEPGDDLWSVKADPTQVDQVLANLCVNARDAIDGSGQIRIHTRNIHLSAPVDQARLGLLAGDYVRLSVRDTGRGMPPELLERVFEPFFTTKRLNQGTGLGLATVYGIAQQNGGAVFADSSLGQGSVFELYFPRHSGAPTEPTTSAVPPRGLPRHATVLVVEDEPRLLHMVERMLQRLDVRVLSANRPADAITVAAAHDGDIDILLTDVIMPQMHGHKLAEILLQTRPRLRTLFMSGYTADAIAKYGVLEPGVRLLEKPFSGQQLADQLAALLE